MPQLRSGKKVECNNGNDQEVASTSAETPVDDTIKEKDDVKITLDLEDGSEDEAPETVSLSKSKDQAISQKHEEKSAINFLIEKEKKRRKNNDEFRRKQKEIRLNREKSRISEEILLKVAQKHNEVAKLQEKHKPNTHMTFEDDDDDTDEEIKDEQPRKGLQLIVLNKTKKQKKEILDSANEFLNKHFYGKRLNRQNTLDDENRKNRKNKYVPGIKFSKKL